MRSETGKRRPEAQRVQASARSERLASEGVRDESPQGRDHEACEGGTIDDSPPRLAGRRAMLAHASLTQADTAQSKEVFAWRSKSTYSPKRSV
jgi:hypothetical protein